MQIDPSWTGGIDALVSEANEWLEALLPAGRFGRSKAGVNPRLVRHYTTERLLSPPLRIGREARYTRRHLLELLALRRLMSDGVSGRALSLALDARSEAELMDLAQQGSAALESRFEADRTDQDEVADRRQAALEYISSLQKESRVQQTGPVLPAEPRPDSQRQLAAAPATFWQTQLTWQAAPGVSLVLEPGAQLPEDDDEWAALMQRMEMALRAAIR